MISKRLRQKINNDTSSNQRLGSGAFYTICGVIMENWVV